MITLTAVNGARFSLRAELVMSVEDQPATTVALTTGIRLQVRESPAAVRELLETAHSQNGRGRRLKRRHATSR